MPEIPTQNPGSTVSGLPQVNPLNLNLANPVTIAPVAPVETKAKTTSVVTDAPAAKDVAKIQQGTTNLQNQINTQSVAKASVPVAQPDSTSGLSLSAKSAKAAQYGMQNYTGTKEQDQVLLQKMMEEKATLEAQMKNQPKGSGYLTEGTGTGTDKVITPQEKALNDFQASQQKMADDRDAMYKDMQTTLEQYKSGTLPLTAEQTAQIETAKATFERLRQQQVIANKQYEGSITNAGIVSGRQRYAREIEMGNVAASVNTGIQKLSDLDAKAVETIADLKSAFQEGNFKKIQSSWDIMTKIQESKAKAVKDTFDAVSSFEKDQRDFDYKEAQDKIRNIMDSDKFDYQQRQDAVNNALNQAQFDEQKKQNLRNYAIQQEELALKRQDIQLKKKEAIKSIVVAGLDPASPTYMDELLAASAGGKSVDVSTRTKISKGVLVLNQLSELQKNIKDQDTGPIIGILRGANPWDEKAMLINAQLTSIIPNLARGTYGEVGVLTDNDVALYSKTIPNLRSTEQVRKAVLAMTVKTVQRSIETELQIAAGTGLDVAGLKNVWARVKTQADALNKDIGIDPEDDGYLEMAKSGLTNFIAESPQNEEAYNMAIQTFPDASLEEIMQKLNIQ